MKKIVFMFSTIFHALAGTGGYLGLAAWAAGAADSGVASGPWFDLADFVVRFILLQPAAFWLIAVIDPRWWTWPGLAALFSITLVNSLILVGSVGWVLRARQRGADSGHRRR